MNCIHNDLGQQFKILWKITLFTEYYSKEDINIFCIKIIWTLIYHVLLHKMIFCDNMQVALSDEVADDALKAALSDPSSTNIWALNKAMNKEGDAWVAKQLAKARQNYAEDQLNDAKRAVADADCDVTSSEAASCGLPCPETGDSRSA